MNTLAGYSKHTYSKCRVSRLISLLTQLSNKFMNKVFRYNLTFLGISRNFIWRGLRKCKREVGQVCKSTCSNKCIFFQLKAKNWFHALNYSKTRSGGYTNNHARPISRSNVIPVCAPKKHFPKKANKNISIS